MEQFELRVWRLHRQGVTVMPAEKTLRGGAHPEGLKWCGPYSTANACGFWVFPPLDIDFVWRGGSTFEYDVINEWTGEEAPFVRSLVRDGDSHEHRTFPENFGGRVKVNPGMVEPNIMQIWTGCVFQTPPGWGLLIRSPINVGMDAPYRIQEGFLETDWMAYDVWINISCQQENVPISLRRDQWPPLAQLVPLPRESCKGWGVREEMLGRDSDEANKIFTGWSDYNYKKYVRRRHEMEKDSATFYKERARHLGKRTNEPDRPQKVIEPKTQRGLPKVIPKRFIRVKNKLAADI